MTENPETNRRKNQKDSSLQAVSDFCRNLIALMSMDLSVESREEDGTITVNLTGQDRPFLLSGSALLLNDIEFLLNRIFGTGTNGNKGIVVDTGDYRHHRKLELKLLAQMASVKVLANKKPLSLQPMAARDRKIIHFAVSEIEGVQSRSEGTGDNRSITIFPL